MANQSLQVAVALSVPIDGNANIPFPTGQAIGSPSSIAVSKLIDSAVNFQALNFKAGDIVYNTTSLTSATVTGVSGSQLTLSNDIFSSTGDEYAVFPGDQNPGCLFHLGTDTAADVVTCDIITAGGSFIGAMKLSTGYQPISILKISNVSSVSGGTVKVTALW